MIENATINVVNSPDDFLSFDKLYNLKSLTLKNVEIKGVTKIVPYEYGGKTIFAEAVTFSNNPNITCCTSENSNEINCPCKTVTQNGSVSNVLQTMNIAVFVAIFLNLF